MIKSKSELKRIQIMKGQKMKTLKEQWVDALRSGEYDKTEEMLHDCENGGYCALGVLAEIHPNINYFDVGEKQTENDYGDTVDLDEGFYYGEEFCDGDLPYNILSHTIQTKIVNMNDSEKYDFDKIADWIDENVVEVKL